MSKILIERIGGFAGFGGKNARLQSRGEIELDELSSVDRQTVERLFDSGGEPAAPNAADMFRYKLSKTTLNGIETIETGEESIPDIIRRSVRDEFI